MPYPETLMIKRGSFLLLLILLISFRTSNPAVADEGMWLFDDPPANLLQEKYGFSPTKDWL